MSVCPKVVCGTCGRPGTVLRMGLCARCTAKSRWNGPRFRSIVRDEYRAIPCSVQYIEEDDEPTEPQPPKAA